jgi:MFS transporter, DHA2 family, multidrug resistance protein
MRLPQPGGDGGTNPWLIVVTVGFAAFMEVLDISIANVALQHIAGSLSASQDESTWVLTSYLVTNAIVLPISGWLASTIGRKRYFIACIIGFSVTSLLCGIAPSLAMLIVARGLQGISGGGLQPNSQAILADTFPPAKRGQAFAAYGLAVVFAPAIGPTLGGWITDNFSWRWVFLLNVPVGILLSLLAGRVLADPPAPAAERKAPRCAGLQLDYVGFALLVIGMGALQIVLYKGQEDDWFGSSLIVHLSIVAALGLIVFVLWELRRADPIVDLRLLADRNFAIGNLLMFMLGFALLATTTLLPLFMQTQLGYTATDAGLVMSPGGFTVILMMPAVGLLIGKVDARLLLAIGFAGSALALFSMTRFDGEIDYATIAWARVYQSLAR